jgi:hypothetical protein
MDLSAGYPRFADKAGVAGIALTLIKAGYRIGCCMLFPWSGICRGVMPVEHP